MAQVKQFTFNPFSENTFVVYDDTKECVIVDPGCYDKGEEQALVNFIQENDLKPVKLLNTHCHLDHIYGNRFVKEKYDLKLYAHKDEEFNINMAKGAAHIFGVAPAESPLPDIYLAGGEVIEFGNTKFKVLFVPGHSSGHVAFFCKEDDFVVSGDVLFSGSIGRMDLPGGDGRVLLTSIKEEMLPLGDKVVVYCGHGPSTTIGEEKRTNPFLEDMH